MLNPLLHPTSSSAPTSPTLTRSVAAASGSGTGAPARFLRQTLSSSKARRLSRVVKCRTVDFTEFPEGMRVYAGQSNNNNVIPPGKMVLRESRSQPGSPVLPTIRVQDFTRTNFVLCYGSEVTYDCIKVGGSNGLEIRDLLSRFFRLSGLRGQ